MSQAHHRKKAPEQVRRALIDAALGLAAEKGLAAISVAAVAGAAGVTKGALFHHFGNRQGLVEAVCADIFEDLDAQIDRYLSEQPPGHGCFTRAYVEAFFATPEDDNPRRALSFSLAVVSDPELAASWTAWMRGRLERHRDTDSGPALEAVRYAADGFWLAELMRLDGTVRAAPGVLRRHLLDLIDREPRPCTP